MTNVWIDCYSLLKSHKIPPKKSYHILGTSESSTRRKCPTLCVSGRGRNTGSTMRNSLPALHCTQLLDGLEPRYFLSFPSFGFPEGNRRSNFSNSFSNRNPNFSRSCFSF